MVSLVLGHWLRIRLTKRRRWPRISTPGGVHPQGRTPLGVHSSGKKILPVLLKHNSRQNIWFIAGAKRLGKRRR
jgi:hypothetical protein